MGDFTHKKPNKRYYLDMNDTNYDTSGGDTLSWNNKWAYPLQLLYESEFARREFHCNLFRVQKAVLGRPNRNLYQEELDSNLEKISDIQEKESAKKACTKVPEGRSFVVRKAVMNRANQMSGGVDTYNYQIYDPYGIIDDDTEELLSATCEQDYILNGLERKAEIMSRDLTEAGVCAFLVKYCPKTDRNEILRINPKNVWWDTKYSSTGEERFRAYSTMLSWAEVKRMIKEDNDEINLTIKAPDESILSEGVLRENAKIGQRKIRTLNGLDIYVQDMNQLATSSQLQARADINYEDYMHTLRSCYNLNWYHSLATDPKAKTNNGYKGDDVELTVLYDLVNHIEFKILNRRYVISANNTAFKRKMIYTITDPRGDVRRRIDDFYLDCPLKFVWEELGNRDLAPFPVSPLLPLLDIHDELCAWRAKREHVSKILSILRIETNAADAQSLKGLLNVMGVVLDDIQGEINSINFQYDYTPIDSEIQYREELIKKTLNAYDEFDALQAMGDRASAAESGMALSAVAQGLATHQNAIMQMYAEIARQCIENRVAYSTKQEFPIVNKGHYSVVTIQEMALTATIAVKPKLAKRVQEKMLAAQAANLLQGLSGSLTPEGITELIVDALMGTVPRKMARSFVKDAGASPEEVALAQQEAQNTAQMLALNQQAYEQNPSAYETQNIMDSYSPEQIDAVIGSMMEDQGIERLSDLDQPAPEEGVVENAEMAAYTGNPNSLVG